MLELAESIHDGLRREVREETGLDVEPTTLTSVYKNLTKGNRRPCLPVQGHRREPDHQRRSNTFRWASQADVDSLMSEAYAIRVLDALQSDPAAKVRNHDGIHILAEPVD